MCHIRNIDDIGLGVLTRKIVTDYNMKPVLTRPQHHWFTDGRTYMECDIDVHIFNQLARRGWHSI